MVPFYWPVAYADVGVLSGKNHLYPNQHTIPIHNILLFVNTPTSA